MDFHYLKNSLIFCFVDLYHQTLTPESINPTLPVKGKKGPYVKFSLETLLALKRHFVSGKHVDQTCEHEMKMNV